MDMLFSFEGRIGRMSWWLGELVALVLFVVGIVIAAAMVEYGPDGKPEASLTPLTAVLGGAALAVWVRLSVTVKRYHDRGKSGVWFLIVFVPIVGPLWQLVECGFLPGTAGGNGYGPGNGGWANASLDAEIEALRRESRAGAGPQPEAVWSTPPSRAVPARAVAARPMRQSAVPTGFGRRGV